MRERDENQTRLKNFMSVETTSRNPYLLVFRDCSVESRDALSPQQLGELLHEWLQWHDRLDSQGIVRFRSSVDAKSRSVSERGGGLACSNRFEQSEPIVGYLLIDAENFEKATDVARGCPGLMHGFVVEVYRSHEIRGGCQCDADTR